MSKHRHSNLCTSGSFTFLKPRGSFLVAHLLILRALPFSRVFQRERVGQFSTGYAASNTERIFPAGSLNQAMVGPFPREIPRESVFRLGSL